jgi:hypothetical protein
MARSRRAEPVLVPIGLTVSETDAARIDQVLARPEYAEWTRAEWCREIVRSALRYYVGEGTAPDPGQPRTDPRSLAAVNPADPVVPPSSEPAPAVPEPVAGAACPHPVDARDYQTGTCAACGAILWD